MCVFECVHVYVSLSVIMSLSPFLLSFSLPVHLCVCWDAWPCGPESGFLHHSLSFDESLSVSLPGSCDWLSVISPAIPDGFCQGRHGNIGREMHRATICFNHLPILRGLFLRTKTVTLQPRTKASA